MLNEVIKGLESRNISGFFAENKKEALKIALSLMEKGRTVGWGGSMSVREIGLYDEILKGERNPSRDVLISIAFGMGLTLEETQFLLRISKFAVLDSREKRDSIIIYSLTHKKNVYETDDLLDNNNIPTLL